MGYAGQKCTASSRVYVADQIAAEFRSALVDEVAELATGDPRSPGTVVGPMISIQARDAAVGAVAAGTDRGIEVLHGGESIDSPGFFMTPTVLYGGDADDPLLTEELFAPVVAVQPVADIDQALERVNALESGIVAGIVSPLHSEIEYFAQRANVGVIRVNAPTTGLEPHVPFGGVGSSSFGPREQGLAGLEAFRESRTIYG
jgi:aldehyde dehydrogenase (NAD+)